MAAQKGNFVSEERLYPRDNSGGTMGPKGCADFGDAGESVGGSSNPNPGSNGGGVGKKGSSSRSSGGY
jgi:hypothetical protein